MGKVILAIAGIGILVLIWAIIVDCIDYYDRAIGGACYHESRLKWWLKRHKW